MLLVNKAILKFIAKDNNGLKAAVTLANITILDSGGTQAGGKNASKMSKKRGLGAVGERHLVENGGSQTEHPRRRRGIFF